MFVLSKVVGILTNPTNLAFLTVALAMVLISTRYRRLGVVILRWDCAILLVIAILPWEEWLVAPLEERFPQPVLPSQVDGIIVLGGVFDPVNSVFRNQPNAGGSVDRVTAMIELARLYPQAKVIFTGGSGSVTEQEFKEGPIVARYLEQLGMQPDRFVFESQSRNTRENATLSKPLANPQPGQVWLLVTSAMHIPRSVGVFRSAGWDVTAWPVDYITRGRVVSTSLRFNLPAGLAVIGTASHEWVGLLSYRLLGWSTDWFPAP